jgi:hypothetical protein
MKLKLLLDNCRGYIRRNANNNKIWGLAILEFLTCTKINR